MGIIHFSHNQITISVLLITASANAARAEAVGVSPTGWGQPATFLRSAQHFSKCPRGQPPPSPITPESQLQTNPNSVSHANTNLPLGFSLIQPPTNPPPCHLTPPKVSPSQSVNIFIDPARTQASSHIYRESYLSYLKGALIPVFCLHCT